MAGPPTSPSVVINSRLETAGYATSGSGGCSAMPDGGNGAIGSSRRIRRVAAERLRHARWSRIGRAASGAPFASSSSPRCERPNQPRAHTTHGKLPGSRGSTAVPRQGSWDHGYGWDSHGCADHSPARQRTSDFPTAPDCTAGPTDKASHAIAPVANELPNSGPSWQPAFYQVLSEGLTR